MSEADAVAKLARESQHAHIVASADRREFLVKPAGATIEEITDEHGLKTEAPRYIRQTVTLQMHDSLVEYVNRFKSAHTLLFADIGENAIVAQLDYHAPDQASNVAHRARLAFPFSEEWKLWTGISGRLMPQLEFARFIEENAADVRAPAAADLIEAVRTSSENESFEYSDETKASTKGGIELPTKFKLGLPVYFGEPEVELFAFLRWKIDVEAGGLTLGIALHRAEHVRQAVFRQIVLSICERTERPAVFGKL